MQLIDCHHGRITGVVELFTAWTFEFGPGGFTRASSSITAMIPVNSRLACTLAFGDILREPDLEEPQLFDARQVRHAPLLDLAKQQLQLVPQGVVQVRIVLAQRVSRCSSNKLMWAGSVIATPARDRSELLPQRLPPLLDLVGHGGELLLKPMLRIPERALRFKDAAGHVLQVGDRLLERARRVLVP